jgi:hypothetical protein
MRIHLGRLLAEAFLLLLARYPTKGATKSGENAFTISSGLQTQVSVHIVTNVEVKSHQIVAVIAVPAEGAMQLARIPYRLPSIARVRVRPIMAALAVEYYNVKLSDMVESKTQDTHVGLTKVAVYGTRV